MISFIRSFIGSKQSFAERVIENHASKTEISDITRSVSVNETAEQINQRFKFAREKVEASNAKYKFK